MIKIILVMAKQCKSLVYLHAIHKDHWNFVIVVMPKPSEASMINVS